MEPSQEELYSRAAAKVKARKSFYINLINYLIINLLLALINYINYRINDKFIPKSKELLKLIGKYKKGV